MPSPARSKSRSAPESSTSERWGGYLVVQPHLTHFHQLPALFAAQDARHSRLSRLHSYGRPTERHSNGAYPRAGAQARRVDYAQSAPFPRLRPGHQYAVPVRQRRDVDLFEGAV